jgi:hypothetical protein
MLGSFLSQELSVEMFLSKLLKRGREEAPSKLEESSVASS